MTQQEVAEKFGMTRQHISQLLMAWDMPPLPRRESAKVTAERAEYRAKMTQWRKERDARVKEKKADLLLRLNFALEDYKLGMGYVSLTRKYGLGQQVLVRFIKKMGANRTHRESMEFGYRPSSAGINKRNRRIYDEYVKTKEDNPELENKILFEIIATSHGLAPIYVSNIYYKVKRELTV